MRPQNIFQSDVQTDDHLNFRQQPGNQAVVAVAAIDRDFVASRIGRRQIDAPNRNDHIPLADVDRAVGVESAMIDPDSIRLCFLERLTVSIQTAQRHNFMPDQEVIPLAAPGDCHFIHIVVGNNFIRRKEVGFAGLRKHAAAVRSPCRKFNQPRSFLLDCHVRCDVFVVARCSVSAAEQCEGDRNALAAAARQRLPDAICIALLKDFQRLQWIACQSWEITVVDRDDERIFRSVAFDRDLISQCSQCRRSDPNGRSRMQFVQHCLKCCQCCDTVGGEITALEDARPAIEEEPNTLHIPGNIDLTQRRVRNGKICGQRSADEIDGKRCHAVRKRDHIAAGRIRRCHGGQTSQRSQSSLQQRGLTGCAAVVKIRIPECDEMTVGSKRTVGDDLTTGNDLRREAAAGERCRKSGATDELHFQRFSRSKADQILRAVKRHFRLPEAAQCAQLRLQQRCLARTADCINIDGHQQD